MVGDICWGCIGDGIGASGDSWVAVGGVLGARGVGWVALGDEVGARGGGWVVMCVGGRVKVGGGWELSDEILIGESAKQMREAG